MLGIYLRLHDDVIDIVCTITVNVLRSSCFVMHLCRLKLVVHTPWRRVC